MEMVSTKPKEPVRGLSLEAVKEEVYLRAYELKATLTDAQIDQIANDIMNEDSLWDPILQEIEDKITKEAGLDD